MFTNHVANATTTPLALSYPSLPQRVGECIFGSTRREALKALRSATADQWSYTSTHVPSVSVLDSRGNEVLFQYDSHNNLVAVHLTSARGKLHITGDCELAQRLTRFATRALSSLLQRTTSECKEQLTRFTAGALATHSHYEHRQSHRHIARDGYESTDNKTATVELPARSSIKITSRVYTYRLPADERWTREQERLAWCAHLVENPSLVRECEMSLDPPHHSTPAIGAMLATDGYNSTPAKFYFPPPPPSDRGSHTSLKVEVKNQKLDALASAFGVEPLGTRFSQLCAADRVRMNSILTQALTRAERSMTTSSQGPQNSVKGPAIPQ
jgi:hypothetical protein